MGEASPGCSLSLMGGTGHTEPALSSSSCHIHWISRGQSDSGTADGKLQSERQVRPNLGDPSRSLSMRRSSGKGSTEQEIPRPRRPGVMLEHPSRMSSCSGDKEPRTGHSQNRRKTGAKLLPETEVLSLQSSLHKPKPTREETPPGKSTREAKESCTCPGEQHFPRSAAVPNSSATRQIKDATWVQSINCFNCCYYGCQALVPNNG